MKSMTRELEHDSAFSLRISSKIKAAAEEAAKAEGIGVNAWIRKAINEKLQRENEKKEDELREAIIQVIKMMKKEGEL